MNYEVVNVDDVILVNFDGELKECKVVEVSPSGKAMKLRGNNWVCWKNVIHLYETLTEAEVKVKVKDEDVVEDEVTEATQHTIAKFDKRNKRK